MKKQLISFVTALTLLQGAAQLMPQVMAAEAGGGIRIMEKLNRGLVAVKVSNGVYLSWRLLGTESLENQAFDIYRDGQKIHTTGAHDATCYTDTTGKASNSYIVVPMGQSIENETAVTAWTTNAVHAGSVSSYSERNSFAYMDIPIFKPEGGTARQDPAGKNDLTKTIYKDYSYSANDASVGDLDGDGDYEIVLKWNPSNSEDSGTQAGNYTGNVYIDGYQMDKSNKNYMWRIDLGCNIRAGAHYTQFIVYDLDGDGKAEIAMKTAPGSKDGQNNYVTEAGDTEEIRNADNSIDYRQEEYGGSKGRILQGPEYLTIFDGETGAAIYTTDYIPRGTVNDWGDGYGNRSERYLAGVAYLDGVHPSLIMTRGYYMKAVAYAYNFDGKKLNKVWECNGNTAGVNSLYGQGAHSLSIADIDNDGKDEIVYCSAAIDDDGTVIGNTRLGHGDALHVSDFNNDGVQEAFSVKEDPAGYTNNAADFRIPKQAPSVWGQGAGGDTGRGVMANIDDAYAQENPNALSLGWSSSHPHVFGLNGEVVNPANKTEDEYGYGSKPNKAAKGSFDNFLIYWDGDLGRELLDDYVIQKYYASTGSTRRFYTGNNSSTFSDIHHNNDTKRNMSLVADILGDWREEVMAPTSDDSALRIFMSTIPTDYRLTTLMHDSQYRCAIAWQNVGYNQPPHQSYYIGSAALAKDLSGKTLNYLAPETPFTVMTYPGYEEAPAPTMPAETSTSTIYERGTGASTAWSEGDLSDWTQTGDATLNYSADGADYGNINYSEQTPATAFTATKTFALAADATVTFDLKWEYGSVIHANKKVNTIEGASCPYIQIGDSVRLMWYGVQSYYKLYYSTDGGETYMDVGGTKKQNARYTSSINAVIDTKTGKLVFLSCDGTVLASDISVGSTDYVTLGLKKGTGAYYGSDTKVNTSLDSIKVTQETTGATITSITASPKQSTYQEGTAFNKNDVEVTAHYSDGSEKLLSSYYYTVTGYDKDKAGVQELTAHYGNLEAKFNVTVANKQVTNLTISGTYKTAYNVGESLNLDGMVVTAAYSNGTSGEVEDYTVTGFDNTKAGSQTVTVNYGGKTAAFNVTVSPKPRTDTYIDASGTVGASVKAELKNYTGSAELILAVYDGNGIVVNVQSQRAGGELSFNTAGISGSYYKVFAWNTLNNLTSLCPSFDSREN